MSATRDKSQKITFVYSNLYQLYRKGKDAAVSSDPQAIIRGDIPASASGQVLKAESLYDAASSPKVRSYDPALLLAKRVASKEVPVVGSVIQKPASVASGAQIQNQALTSLRQNLDSLNDLHARLRFMLQELEELIKK